MAPDSVARAHILVMGRVQGVGFRAFAMKTAVGHGLRGGVRNLSDGRVEVDVEGDKASIETFLGALRAGPPLGRVDHMDIRWDRSNAGYAGFEIWFDAGPHR